MLYIACVSQIYIAISLVSHRIKVVYIIIYIKIKDIHIPSTISPS